MTTVNEVNNDKTRVPVSPVCFTAELDMTTRYNKLASGFRASVLLFIVNNRTDTRKTVFNLFLR